MIARWKERTGRSPPDCLYSKTCRRARSPPFSVGCSQCGVLPGFLPARGHGQRVNQLEPEPRSFCSFSARPSIKPPLHPLPCSSFGLFLCHFFFFRRPSPLWYSPPLHVRGKNGFKRSISDSLPASFSKPPRSGARPPSCFGSEKREGRRRRKWRRRRWIGVDRIAMARGPDGGGEKMGGGREGEVLHLSIFAYIKTHSRGKGGGREGERLIFHANRPLMEETNLLSALSWWT